MQESRSFSSQILRIILPVSLVILFVCIGVSLFYFFQIRQIVFSGTDALIRKTGESTQNDLTDQAKRSAALLVQERAGNIEKELERLSDSLHETARMICWSSGEHMQPIDPMAIPLGTELTVKQKGALLHMTTPDGTRDCFGGKKIPDLRVLTPLFAAYCETTPEIQSIYFTDAEGYSLDYDEYGRYKHVNLDGRTRPWYEGAVKSGKVFVTDPYEDIYRRGLTVTASFPCLTPDGKLLGVVGIDYGVKKICGHIRNMSRDSSDFFVLLDRAGNVIAGPEDARDMETVSDLLAPVLGRILRMDSGNSHEVSKQGATSHVFWNTVKLAQWKLVLIMPHAKIVSEAENAAGRLRHVGRRTAAEMDGSIRSVVLYLVLMCIGAIVLVIVASFRLAAWLAKPINELNETLKEMRRTGNLRADFQHHAELSRLTRTLQDIFSDWEEELENARKIQKK